jgi:hypothetical protein
MDAKDRESISRIERLRAQRVPPADEPTARDRRAVGDKAGALKQRVKLRTDKTLATMMDLRVRETLGRKKNLGRAAAAWRETIEPYLTFPAMLLDIRRGVLVVLVGSGSQRFELDRQLRGGRKKHFLQRCTAPVDDVKIAVGAPPPLVTPQERRTRTIEEEDAEIQEHLDQGLITPESAQDIRAAWERARREADARDSKAE